MVKLPLTFEKPQLRTGKQQYDVSGVIGLSGDVVGSVIVGFTRSSAMQIASAFAGTRLEIGTADFADAVGELANMIAGGAKAKFEGLDVSIGCPSVVVAPSHEISSPSGAASICIHCNSAAGRFVIDVTVQTSARVNGSGYAGVNEAAKASVRSNAAA
jgi:chemotaxis protein CheX